MATCGLSLRRHSAAPFPRFVEHDVAGARGAGCPAVLPRAGILAGADDAAVETECTARGVWPDALAEGFVWP